MYTVLSTGNPRGSANVGDMLIEHAVKEIVAHEKGETEFLTVFREEPLEPYLDQINASRAVLLSAFPIRDTPLWPVTYRLTEDLGKIEVPLIPIGANWNAYPGDTETRRQLAYSRETVEFLHYVAAQVDVVSCREYYTYRILQQHGVANTVMTGDPAWFDLQSLGKPMKRPAAVERLVYSPPLSAYYVDQGEQVLRMLAELFPDAGKICSMHLADRDTTDGEETTSAALTPEVTLKNRRIRASAAELGFDVRETSGDVARIDFYETCDLHVGYECHAHNAFLRKRIPSVLIHEDARGVGFSYTLGVGGFDGFVRCQSSERSGEHERLNSGYCTTLSEFSLAPARNDVHQPIRQFIEEELGSGFRRYVSVAGYLDDLYASAMRPFVQSLP